MNWIELNWNSLQDVTLWFVYTRHDVISTCDDINGIYWSQIRFCDVQSNSTILTECVKFNFNYLCGHISTHWDLFQQILKHMLDMKNWNYLFDIRLQNILNYKWIQCGFVLSVDKTNVYFFSRAYPCLKPVIFSHAIRVWFHNQAIQLSDNPNIWWPNIKSVDVLI